MSKRVTNVVFENCTAIVYYSDCTSITYDISNCGDKTPDDKNPGDWPDPQPVEDVRCRVAIHVASDIVDRFMDFLNNLDLVNPNANVPAFTYALNRLSVYQWPVSTHGALVNFYNSLGIGTTFVGNTAKGYYDNNTALALSTVQELLYCVLPSTGSIVDITRSVFAVVLNTTGGEFYELLADFVTLWPLSDLRYLAALASTTTDAVDCSTFDCGGENPITTECNAQAIEWTAVAATPAQWEAVSGTLDITGWGGEAIHVSPPSYGTMIPLETTTRNPNETWRATGAVSPGGNALRYMAIQWTPDEPCVIEKLSFRHISNSGGGTKTGAVAVQLMDGTWVVLESVVYGPAPVNDVQITGWEGTPMAIQSVIFLAGHYRGSGSVTIQITRCYINVD